MRTIYKYLFVVTFVPFLAAGQTVADANHQSMIDAELAFSRMAKEKNTRDAFLAFLSDSAVTFGATARIGKKYLEAQPASETWLYWKPVFSDIAADGSFGFNTGPWELRENKGSADPVAFGRFVTVWKKEGGEWRAAIDIGISHSRLAREDSFRVASIMLKNLRPASTSSYKKVFAEEQRFIRNYAASNTEAYKNILSQDAIIYRHQFFPFSRNTFPGADVIRAKSYRPLGGEIASSGDLAYIYGEALILGKDSKRISANYLRIWKKEDGKNWKIVVDVLSYL